VALAAEGIRELIVLQNQILEERALIRD
jgi:hypothetical protein